MSHIIINKATATALRGTHGRYSAIEPIALPDGNYIIPEACLSDVDLQEVHQTIINAGGEIQPIVDLPEIGQPCEMDRIYKYSEGIEQGYNGLVICRQRHNRTEHPVMTIPNLFSFFRGNTDELLWIPNETVKMGWKRWYNAKQYEVIQPHTTQSDFTPNLAITLWKDVTPVVGYPVWVRPKISTDAYPKGAIVHYPLIDSPLWISQNNGNMQTPDGDLPYNRYWKPYVQ